MDEIACLLDFGMTSANILSGLPQLNLFRKAVSRALRSANLQPTSKPFTPSRLPSATSLGQP